jgi:divalent metal cation (Fe/Co/Zn/Cd) transporter
LWRRREEGEEVDRRVRRGDSDHPEGWGKALSKSAAILVTSFVGFVVVPNELLAYLPLHGVAPRPRDAIVAAWVAIWFVAASVVFVRLQRRRAPR